MTNIWNHLKYALKLMVGITMVLALTKPLLYGQSTNALKWKLNEDGTRYFQMTFLNQTWIRYNQHNTGTTIENQQKDSGFDLGLRRTRIQMMGQITDRTFLYFQFGQNNFNAQTNLNGNRKIAAFFHDAVGEYRVSAHNELKLGAGLTIANGLSRFSQPSIGSILTMDVPVFAQTTVDQTDNFSRKLSLYARGQIGKWDYRLVLSEPFPIQSNGAAVPTISNYATFSPIGHHWQQQAYLIYQFFDHEGHLTPYMTGTYLGQKKIVNIAAGLIHQKNATYLKNAAGDTLYQNMFHWAIESFVDLPLNKEKGSAISAYAGFFNTQYGDNYLRYNGIMNPASGTQLNASQVITGQGPVYGNAIPMFGTGKVVYIQAGLLLPKMAGGSQLLPYAACTYASFERLQGEKTVVIDAGINYLIQGHQSKITLNFQNRPEYALNNGEVISAGRKNNLVLQYQIFL
ncbi:MAG: hypothetical protein IPN73_16415 [Saprospiraceae bacterium]|nr:hypothetical protein [Saprospiraceae bacterium]